MTSANRGEWSELYALGYLLVNGGGFAANEFAKLDQSVFYKVLEVVDNPVESSKKAEGKIKVPAVPPPRPARGSRPARRMGRGV